MTTTKDSEESETRWDAPGFERTGSFAIVEASEERREFFLRERSFFFEIYVEHEQHRFVFLCFLAWWRSAIFSWFVSANLSSDNDKCARIFRVW